MGQKRETGREYALRMIKKQIISLELEPGSMVSEKDLAEKLGLSRTPVREALIELSEGGIIEIYPQRGSAIARIDYELGEEARFMRSVLEGAVVQQVCESAEPEALLKLEENLQLQEFYLEKAETGRLMELDNEFHRYLFEIARKNRVYALMQSLTIHFDRVRNMALRAVKDLKIVQDHKAILEALKNRNGQEARQLMEKHLDRYKIDEAAIRSAYCEAYFKTE